MDVAPEGRSLFWRESPQPPALGFWWRAQIGDLLPALLAVLSAAQQEAQRAQFLVEKAKQEQKQKIVQAEGEATAAKMISCCGRCCGMQLVCLAVLRICYAGLTPRRL